MTVPRVLLVTGVPPSDVGVGGLFLRDLCRLYPRDRLCCFHMGPFPENGKSPDLDGLPMEFVEAPRERADGLRFLRRGIYKLCRPLAETWIEATRIPYLVERAVRFGKNHRVDLVWVPLSTPTTIRIARRIADSLGASLVTTVWDPPEYRLRHWEPDPYTFRRLLRDFDNAIRTSICSGVASEGMKSSYEEKYGTDCVPMIYGPRRFPDMFSEKAGARDGRLVIAYAGGIIYAQDAWKALVDSLAERNWRIAGRDVTIRVMCAHFDQRARAPMNIELLGWRSTLETLRLLSQADIAYLPYWFADEYKEVVRVTFPNKLATYAAARVPALYHGPRDSSVGSFMTRFPLGIGCHSMDHHDIIACLERVAMDSDFLSRARVACDEAYHQELSPEIFRRRFAELMGVTENDLLPVELSDIDGSRLNCPAHKT